MHENPSRERLHRSDVAEECIGIFLGIEYRYRELLKN